MLRKLCILATASLLPLAALAGCASEPEGEPKRSRSIESKPRGAERLRHDMLAIHNAVRQAAGTPPLRWSESLAADAYAHAREMARTGTFRHARNTGQGENLWMGTRGYFSYRQMAGGWVEESQHFRRGPFPQSSATGNWSDVGHYTQMIWNDTRHVGCAVAANRSYEFLVCRYDPAGNVIGEDPLV